VPAPPPRPPPPPAPPVAATPPVPVVPPVPAPAFPLVPAPPPDANMPPVPTVPPLPASVLPLNSLPPHSTAPTNKTAHVVEIRTIVMSSPRQMNRHNPSTSKDHADASNGGSRIKTLRLRVGLASQLHRRRDRR